MFCAVRAMDKAEKEERMKRVEQKRKEEDARRRWAAAVPAKCLVLLGLGSLWCGCSCIEHSQFTSLALR